MSHSIVRLSLWVWRLLQVVAPLLSLGMMGSIPYYLCSRGVLSGITAALAGVIAVGVWGVLLLLWPRFGLSPARRLVLGTGQRRIMQWAASISDADKVYSWLGDGPGVIARSPDGAWLCCEATDFNPVFIGAGTLQSLFVFAFTNPVRLCFMLRTGSRQRSIAIPFVNDLAAARSWRTELQSFVRPAGGPFK